MLAVYDKAWNMLIRSLLFVHPVQSQIRHQFIYSHFKWFFHLMLLFFLQQSLQLFLYSWYFCFGCCCCNYYIGWCCSYALSHALSHSFSQMALLHRSGKHFTVDFISKSPLYFISIALKLLQKIMLCFEKNVKSSVSILWYSWHDTHRVK